MLSSTRTQTATTAAAPARSRAWVRIPPASHASIMSSAVPDACARCLHLLCLARSSLPAPCLHSSSHSPTRSPPLPYVPLAAHDSHARAASVARAVLRRLHVVGTQIQLFPNLAMHARRRLASPPVRFSRSRSTLTELPYGLGKSFRLASITLRMQNASRPSRPRHSVHSRYPGRGT